jgi:lactate dehydrogenase-like 2-hydroxyacid dehydrogenase
LHHHGHDTHSAIIVMKITAYETRKDERQVFMQLAEEHHIEITYLEEALTASNVHLAAGTEGVTILGGKVDSEILGQLKAMNINYIATRTVGYNNIDLDSAKALGICVSNASYGPEGVADYTIMLILMSLRKYKQAMFRANVNDYSLNGLQGREMKDLTIGILGTGRIGARVIESLSGFGCKIIAYDNFQNPSIKHIATYVALEELYQQSDVISLHIPLFESTIQIINSDSLSLMKDGVVLINCSRGELMNIPALIDAIEHEKIGALALDVFENEAGIYHFDRRTEIIKNREMAYLRQFPNVIMTQHMAFYTDAAVESMVNCGVNNLISFISNGRAANQII